MANSIKFMNEGFEAKYGNIKPDLCEQIYTVLKRLTEANISPEDEADTKLLYSIYNKKMKRSNAQLSPKELQVLDKYNLEEPRTSKDYYGRKDVRSSTHTDSEFRGPNVFEPVKRDGSINRKANLADRAKKMNDRSNSRDDIGKYDKDYRLNYMYMKNAVNDKKYNQRKLDNLDREYDQEESNLRARLDALKKEREQEKSRYNSAIKNSQYEINTLLKRESLDKLQEAISTLNERKQEWSDEDKVDSELLYSIYDKKLQRSNAALTPEEKAVLNKYNLGDVYSYKNSWGTKRAATGYTQGSDVYEPIKRGQHVRSTETNRKVNLADRARKMGMRAYNKGAVGEYDRDFKNNYNTMKDDIWSRKYHQKNLDSLDKEYDEKEAKLLKQLDSLKKDKENSKRYHQGALDTSNSRINKMLKRESLLSEDGGYDNYYGGNKDDFISDLNDVEKALDSVYDSLATHRAQQLVDDFLYDLDLKRKRAGKVESLNKKLNNNYTNNLQEATISKAMQKLYDMEDDWNFIPGEVYTVVDDGRLTRDRLKFVEIFNDGREEIYKFKPVSQTAVEIAKEEANARGEEYDGFAYLNKESVFYSFFDGLPEKPTPRQKLPDDYVGWTDWRGDYSYGYYKKYKNASKNVNITIWQDYGEYSLTISARIGSNWENVVRKEFDSEEEAKQYVENWISQYKDYINSTPPKKGTKFMIPSYLVDIDKGEISGRLKSRIVDN